MKGKKILLSRAMNLLGCLDTINLINRTNLYVINYHRLYRPPLKTDFNSNVFTHTEEVFLKQLKWFMKNFDIFSEEDLLLHLEGNKPLKRRTIIITFDDGYLDNYEIAYPLLKRFKVPAIYFIPYNQIEGKSLAWWDMLAYFIKNATVKFITITERRFNLQKQCDRIAALDYLCWQYQIRPLGETTPYLHQCHARLGVQKSFGDIAKLAQKQFMNWDQIRELSRNNITIGSHTLNHNVLSSLTKDEQTIELTQSKGLLEEKINHTVNTIAYPVGKEQHFTEETKVLARKAGYKAGFSFINGYSKNNIQDKFSIPRIDLCPESSSHFKAQTLLASVF